MADSFKFHLVSGSLGLSLGLLIGSGILYAERKKIQTSFFNTNFAERTTSTRRAHSDFKRKHFDTTFYQKITKYGAPSENDILLRPTYISSYDYARKQPFWVLERITAESVTPTLSMPDRKKCIFMQDPDIPHNYASKNDDYKYSGYQRGHLAASANHLFDQDNQCLTFLLSNTSPQVGRHFNQNIWARLENFSRDLLNKNFDEVFIVTGPLFVPKMENGKLVLNYELIGDNIAVPTHFFKVILAVDNANKKFLLKCYMIPNEEIMHENFDQYSIDIEELEKISNLKFFEKFDKSKMSQSDNPTEKTKKKKKKRKNLSKSSPSPDPPL